MPRSRRARGGTAAACKEAPLSLRRCLVSENSELVVGAATRSAAPRPHAPHSGCCPLFPGCQRPRCHASGALRHQRGRGAGCRRQAAARRNAGNHGNSADAPPRRAPHAATNATLGAGRRRCTARGRARRPPVAPRRTGADTHRPRPRRRRIRPPRRSRSRSRRSRSPRPTRRRALSGAAPSKRVRSLSVPAPPLLPDPAAAARARSPRGCSNN